MMIVLVRKIKIITFAIFPKKFICHTTSKIYKYGNLFRLLLAKTMYNLLIKSNQEPKLHNLRKCIGNL